MVIASMWLCSRILNLERRLKIMSSCRAMHLSPSSSWHTMRRQVVEVRWNNYVTPDVVRVGSRDKVLHKQLHCLLRDNARAQTIRSVVHTKVVTCRLYLLSSLSLRNCNYCQLRAHRLKWHATSLDVFLYLNVQR